MHSDNFFPCGDILRIHECLSYDDIRGDIHMNKILRKIIIAAFLIVTGAGFLFAGDNIVFQQTYPVSAVYGVDIDLVSEQVEIALWNRNEFRVTVVSSYSDYPVTELTGGILSCKDRTGNTHRCMVEIKVPESFYAQSAYGGWSISTVSGSVKASKLWGENITAETVSGSINLSKCETQIADISSNSGSITLSKCIISGKGEFSSTTGAIMYDGVASSIDAESTTGAITLSFDQFLTQDLRVESGTGAVSISLPENPGFKFVFDTSTGSVYNAFTGYSGGKSGVDTYGSGYVIISAETRTGSIRVLRK